MFEFAHKYRVTFSPVQIESRFSKVKRSGEKKYQKKNKTEKKITLDLAKSEKSNNNRKFKLLYSIRTLF